jgi:hypothetical protein
VTKHRVAAVALLVTSVLIAAWLFALLRPYDAVRFPPAPATVTPSVIKAGGEVTLTREAYCNDGVDITLTRWADRIDEHGRVTASLSLPPVQFYPAGPACVAPSVQRIVIPDYIKAAPAVPGGPDVPTKYRLRFETSYQANPIRVVTVESLSEPFVILPSTEGTP